MDHFSHLEISNAAELTNRIEHALNIVKQISEYCETDPMVENDYGGADCFFCHQDSDQEHDSDCIYLQAKQVFSVP